MFSRVVGSWQVTSPQAVGALAIGVLGAAISIRSFNRQARDFAVGMEVPADAIQSKLEQQRAERASHPTERRVNDLPRSVKRDGRFVLTKEDFPTWQKHDVRKILEWRKTMTNLLVLSEDLLERELPVRTPDRDVLANPSISHMQATWLGHASVLVQWQGWNVLADPMFSERCSPVQWYGPARERPSPLQADELPKIDVVVVSHNHYDHLDRFSVEALAKQRPPPMWFVPLGMKSWMAECGVRNCVEMDWSEASVLEDSERPSLTVRCIPCQHWCRRGLFDENKCLWASWICSTSSEDKNAPPPSFFFGGDTGYCNIFTKVGKTCGPISLAAIPIGAYGSTALEKQLMKPSHMDPAEAVQCHLDLGARRSIAIHWGTFRLTSEDLLEPPSLLREACQRAEPAVAEDEFLVLQHGETRKFPLQDR